MSQYPAILEFSSLDGTNGFQINGEAFGDRSGLSVASAGDINNDGFADVIVGAFMADPNGDQSGATYVVFGKATAFGPEFELSSLDGNNGFQISGATEFDQSGFSVDTAGDMNGDGIGDLIIGALIAGPNNGAAYVVFGKAGGFGADLNLSALDGTNGFRIDGASNTENLGYSVSSAGDVNGDGFDDVLMEAGFANSGGGNRFGAAYVVFGSDSGFAASLSVSALDGNNGFKLNCEAEVRYDVHTVWVSSAGDVNGDGIADVFVGARVASGGPGAGYVVFGTTGGFAASLDLSALDGTDGFKLSGLALGTFKAPPVASAGDINGDGFDDMILGAPYAQPHGNQSGAAYVVFGHAGSFGALIDVSTLDGANGFKLSGEDVYDRAGCSVASAGDFNGDGFDDLIVGAYEASPHGNESGAVYVVFGKAAPFSPNLDLSSLDGNNGFKLNGENESDFTGLPVSSAGDINGDGFADLIVGANGADPHGAGSGASYVVFGSKPSQAVVRTGTDIGQVIHGGDFDDTLSGLGGDDILFGHDGGDTLNGGAQSDTLFGGAGIDTLDGGVGNDTLDGGAGSDTFILSGGGNDTAYGGISGGADAFNFGGAFGAADTVDGGGGVDTIRLAGDYSAGVLFHGTTMVNVEAIVLASGFGYSLTLNDGNVAKDKSLAVDASALGAADFLHFDGSKEHDGSFAVSGGAGTDVLAGGRRGDSLDGGDGDDFLTGGKGADQLSGGLAADTFVYGSPKDSLGAKYDTVTGFDALGADRFDLAAAVTGIDQIIASGALSAASFASDLKTAAHGNHLGAHHAVLFTPDSGDLAGTTFLIVDLDGQAGYASAHDMVIRLDAAANLSDLDVSDFI